MILKERRFFPNMGIDAANLSNYDVVYASDKCRGTPVFRFLYFIPHRLEQDRFSLL